MIRTFALCTLAGTSCRIQAASSRSLSALYQSDITTCRQTGLTDITIIDTTMDKEKLLLQLNEKMHKTCRCALKSTALHVVPGKGSANAQIMFVGEAPGKKEDEMGEPFIGAAGKLLSDMLLTIDLSRDDVYITNVVKYRPPNNRDPLPQEVADCRAWLEEQVSLIDPDLIVPLGRHALERFVPGKRISEAHGKAFRREIPGLGSRMYFALYHPAAALYNGALRETLFADFQRIPAVLALISKGK